MMDMIPSKLYIVIEYFLYEIFKCKKKKKIAQVKRIYAKKCQINHCRLHFTPKRSEDGSFT